MQTFEVLQQLYLAEDEAFVAGLFREFLDSDPDPTIYGELIEDLKCGGTRNGALDRIIHSTLFERLFTETPPLVRIMQNVMAKEGYEFVRALLDVTGMEPTFQKLQNGLDSLEAGMSRLELFETQLLLEMSILESAALQHDTSGIAPAWASFFGYADGAFVLGLYQELLDREPSWEELSSLSEALISGQSRLDAFKTVLRGSEFAGLVQKAPAHTPIRYLQSIRGLDAAPFITEVYRECLGREPDGEGLRFYEKKLQEGASRLEIIRRIMLSPEAKSRYRVRAFG